MKVEFRCSRCGHHLTLNVLDPQRQSPPTCGCRPGKRGVVMERVEGEHVSENLAHAGRIASTTDDPGSALTLPGLAEHTGGVRHG